MSRIVSGDRRLDRHEKEVLRKMLRQAAEFSGVEILAYCVMSNHFHVLIRVPKGEEELSRDEVLRRYRVLYEKSNSPGYPDAEGMRLILEGSDEELAKDWMRRLQARMGDVSEFIRTLKQRFSIWYNKSRGHIGTVWAERFKSVLIEDDPQTLKTVAAYLDLNPVRAKLVDDPADYRWCSYAEAMGGDAVCASGLARVMGRERWRDAVADYRMVLFGKGGTARRGEQGVVPAERVDAVLRKGGEVEAWELLRCRVRHFSDGAILGSEGFVRTTMLALATVGVVGNESVTMEVEVPTNSKTGGKKRLGRLRVAGLGHLCSFRDLQRSAVTESFDGVVTKG